MWFALRMLGAIVLAILLGAGSAAYAIYGLSGGDIVRNGPWRTDLRAGSPSADNYTRSYVALTGLLALNKNETIYFEATSDSAGEPLDGNCSYRIEGADPDARWWSITVYGHDHLLIPNTANRYAVSQTTVLRATDGKFTIRLSATPEQGNWIATSEEGFEILLRLYNPGELLRQRPESALLPSIIKEACS
jgi:hypothetical protein